MNLLDMKVFVSNLGKYNEGETVGEWFDYPFDEEHISEVIGLNEQYEEYFITDYELPFEIGEYISISELNKKCELVEEIMDSSMYADMKEIINTWFGSLEEFAESKDDIIVYSDCDNMTEVAQQFVEETVDLESLPGRLGYYFDYEKLGRDMELEGNFLVGTNCVYEYTN